MIEHTVQDIEMVKNAKINTIRLHGAITQKKRTEASE